MGAVLFAMAFTSVISAYLIKYNHQIYVLFERLLTRTGIRRKGMILPQEDVKPHAGRPITVLGYHRGAQALIEFVSLRKPELLSQILVIDFNLETVRELEARKIAYFYGDVSHADTLVHAGIAETKIIISTIPDILLKGTSNAGLVQMCRKLNPQAFVIATADVNQQIPELKKAGASEVMLPYFETAAHLTEVLINLTNTEKISSGTSGAA
jgi:Trk K+ transport system NAD-binding subunit